MKALFAILAIISFLQAEPLEWRKLNFKQRLAYLTIKNIARTYDDERLPQTMIAIAWQESRLGLVPINLADPSCGIFHITAKTYLYQNGIKDTLHNRNVACAMLIESVELSTHNAIKYFLAMKKHFKGDHEKAIKAYNAGYRINSKAANEYLRLIKKYEKGDCR